MPHPTDMQVDDLKQKVVMLSKLTRECFQAVDQPTINRALLKNSIEPLYDFMSFQDDELERLLSAENDERREVVGKPALGFE